MKSETSAPTSPLHQFRTFVAQDLQRAHRWVGAAGYELAKKYAALVHQLWVAGASVEATARAVNDRYMADSAPKAVGFPTMASMAAVGCKFYGSAK
jgi:hypothetical protein